MSKPLSELSNAVRINPKKKMFLYGKKILIGTSKKHSGSPIYEIGDNEIIVLYFNFDGYRKAFAIKTDRSSDLIDLDDTSIHGEIIAKYRRKECSDLIKYLRDIEKDGHLSLSEKSIHRLSNLIKTKGYKPLYFESLIKPLLHVTPSQGYAFIN